MGRQALGRPERGVRPDKAPTPAPDAGNFLCPAPNTAPEAVSVPDGALRLHLMPAHIAYVPRARPYCAPASRTAPARVNHGSALAAAPGMPLRSRACR
jgi:hypothetical protein